MYCKQCKSIRDGISHIKHKIKRNAASNAYYYENHEAILKANKRENLSEPEVAKLRLKAREFRKANPAKYRLQKKRYYQANKERINKKCAERRRSDPNIRLLNNLRSRLSAAFKGNHKTSKTIELLGCSLEDFKRYLEKLFKPGMTFDNYGRGGWELDRIVPCADFDLSNIEEQKRCFHYTNIQPLWAQENQIKNRFK